MPTMQRGGGFHGKSAYYSVDVFVDCLETPLVGCRVPSVAFQFLDFPAITVYSPTAGEIRPGDTHRHSFNQGKSCVFEMAEYELEERMRREPLRLAWVATWQRKEKALGVVNVPLRISMFFGALAVGGALISGFVGVLQDYGGITDLRIGGYCREVSQ